MTAPNKHIVILGGGSAGWIAANLMAVHMIDKGFTITLVESPNIETIGVGEGSTPALRGFMQTIGLDESDWMTQCNATYKAGITFKNWSTKAGFSEYVHPFLSQPDQFSVPAFFHNSYLIRKGVDLQGHPNPFFLNAELIQQKLSPIAPDNFPFEINYGYHFDAGLLGQCLANHAIKKGVVYQTATVSEVALTASGNINYLKTTDNDIISADLFVDATGFKAQLIQQTLNVPFVSYKETLFNDSAVVLATPAHTNIAPHTVSSALKNGWAWQIPLQNRVGNGYVYSSQYCTAEQAEAELRAHLNITESSASNIENSTPDNQTNVKTTARHLKFKVGRVENHWVKNCLAIGLSQGFVEPLEATALDMVQETVVRFIEAYLNGDTAQNRADFNQRINKRFDAIKDYIVCHYRINSRTDTLYWRENASNEAISPSLRAILTHWMQGNNITDELERQGLDNYFPNISWNCLLAGKGLYPSKNQLRAGNAQANQYKMADIEKFIKGCSLNFEPHMQTLSGLADRSSDSSF